MKTTVKIALCAMLVLSMLASCALIPSDTDGNNTGSSKAAFVDTERTYAVGNYGVSFSLAGDWNKTDAENFDLQLSSDKYGANISVFVFYKVDLAENSSVENLFNQQNDSLFANRQNVTTVNEAKTETVGTKTVYSKTTSAERDGNKNYYRTYMVDNSESKVFVWVLVNSAPSDMQKNQDYFDSIVKNVKFG